MAGIKDIELVLEEFGVTLQNDLIKNLEKKLKENAAENGGSFSGQNELSGKLKYQVINKEQTVYFTFYMPQYGSYLDDGTRGATKRGGGKQMHQSIIKWMEQRNMGGNFALNIYKSKLKDASKSKMTFDKATSALAYAIKRSINKHGIRYHRDKGYKGGNNWFTDIITDGRIDKLAESISELIGREVVVNLEL